VIAPKIDHLLPIPAKRIIDPGHSLDQGTELHGGLRRKRFSTCFELELDDATGYGS
jgi:hypothetical protein